MRIEILSDHVSDQMSRVEEVIEDHRSQVSRQQRNLGQGYTEYHAARKQKGFLKKLLGIQSSREQEALFKLKGAQRSIYEANQRGMALHQHRERLAGGRKGEASLLSGLSWLSDDWVYLAGYRNGGGEIDAILVGPEEVWAVEVKNQRAHLHVDGEEWWFDKFDNYGNLVDRKVAADRSGRNWGRQVTDPAERLEKWLSQRGHPTPINTAVVLVNPRATLGRIWQPSVNLITCNPQDIVSNEQNIAPPGTHGETDAIVKLIKRDHWFHAKRRARRKR